MRWPSDSIREQEPLANHTSFRIGGPAEFFAEPTTLEELVALLRGARTAGLPVWVLGGGTNLLVVDRGVLGLAIRLGRAFQTIEVEPAGDPAAVIVRCGSALLTQRLVRLAAQEGWGDLERLAGLPGQVGGAVVMNAQEIGRFVEQVTVVSWDGEVIRLGREALRFGYRYTALEPGVLTDVVFRFSKVEPAAACQAIQQALAYRNSTQELQLPSAGCAFKNPPHARAGLLLDQAGLKGSRIGNAQVSRRHANFIVNLGNATCDDVLALMEHMQRCVAKTSGIWLEPEVRLIGERWTNGCA